MRAMFRTLRPYGIALVCSWIGLFVAALIYSHEHPQLHWIMSAALPAFLTESIFYLAAGFEATRGQFARISSARAQAGLLWISALVPYLIFSLSAGTFSWNALRVLAVLCAVLAFWYAVLPRRAAYDVGFLIVAAVPILLRVFPRIYVSPDSHLRVDALGHLMWIRLGIMALLVVRGWAPGAFSFWPRLSEWRAGIVCYLLSILPIIGLALGIHDVRFEPATGEWWVIAALAIGTFFGILWVVAFSEELFFRGVLAQAIFNGSESRVLAVAVSALVFGSAHLWFHKFPDWRQALVATVLGVACGIVYLRTGSVRAPMVTHAFVVMTWRVLFK